ncbi:MAG: tRNA (guanosine(37)-N1)-methyltransferase TrmD [Ignavibacteria bacterium RIFOXYB2_FULL_35_12]|nr:MAG: tRNA (guanosine(37)-N1)-methyltransferase TrmD [Ignavibacteria bacterium GWA2_36_19]OGU61518.1 MAG: tRNA (guanosine(37)-N1)-methyltransferase TrmD [Ignavibacteria bacterium GWF2_35_20]OGU81540.1 MAG: tRNA (guanosine(37)-N1)-methyltransferase TrmD [Ignavibacteria bacterium RIFOXYA2_FULL_35_9]OGU85550.1 MAG: tRNA (guanosine(37)-N1)-methyltransferase TrmD [Ignavibacteria bacterium RIFOXYA12_FULL_35_25]OGU90318.1 MAG: tRNA (guanosine(37)-N1)-methyltransferase TrmD [Ignavibacteria bacterium 
MRIDILTAVPEVLNGPLQSSIIKRAQDKGKVEIFIHNVRDYAYNKHKQIDDKPFGGGAGMVLKPEPFFECIEKLQSERKYEQVIFTTPKGKIFNQQIANKLSLQNNLMFIAGHYKDIDDRVREKFATDEISLGNFVLTGGELPSLVIIDAIVRVIPGVLNDSESALNDSFQDGEKIEAPSFTRPAEYKGMKVPEVLLSGNDKQIKDWKEEQSKLLTERWKKYNN